MMKAPKVEKYPVRDVKQNEKYERIFLDQKEGRYPVVRGTFRFGDLRSSVAAVFPSPDYSLQMQAIKLGACIVGSVNTSSA